MKARLIVLAVVAALVAVGAASAGQLDVIRGTTGPDTLHGTSGADVIYARAGNDVVRGGQGNDAVYGGPGDDVLWAGAGADVQYGGQGNDVLHALANDNQRDVLDCGQGLDVAYVIEHDPVTLHGCEQVIRLGADQAAALAQENGDN